MQQQQRFYLTSLCLEGGSCHSVLLVQLLIAFGSHLRRLRADFDCLLNLIIDVENNFQLKSVMLYRYLIYLELDTIYELVIDSGDFRRVVTFLFDNSSSLRHVTLFPMWYSKIFDSSEDMKLLIEILSSFKHCKQLISIVFCHCIFSEQSYNNREITSIENDFRKWLNDNTHLTYEENFHLECNMSNKTIKLWLK
jgi:hypothetical protein